MSVKQIIGALETTVSTTLGSDWSQLDYVYDLEKNSNRSASQSFGVGVSSGSTSTGRTKAVTFDQSFFVILTKKVNNRRSDKSERASIDDLYDAFETLDKEIFQKKLGLSGVILSVVDISRDEPQPLDDNVVSLRSDYTIKFRNNTF